MQCQLVLLSVQLLPMQFRCELQKTVFIPIYLCFQFRLYIQFHCLKFLPIFQQNNAQFNRINSIFFYEDRKSVV